MPRRNNKRNKPVREAVPVREAAMVNYKEPENLKGLIGENDQTIRHAWEMAKHGEKFHKGRSVAFLEPEELDEEIGKFMNYCNLEHVVPTQVGLCLWLGIDIQTMRAWTSRSDFTTHSAVSKAVNAMHHIVEQKTLDGEIPTQLFMFYSKNWFGLRDKTEVVHQSDSTQVIDISEQQRILRSTPGVVMDAEVNEHSEDLALPEPAENLATEDLGDLLRGSENSGTHTSEDLATEDLATEDFDDLD